jgi:hypothetical protein
MASDARLFKEQYQEWCRLQLQLAHHDIWWVKGAQLKAGNLTLLLLAVIVGASKLVWKERVDVPETALIVLSVLGGLVVLLGGLYSLDLFNEVVKARARARKIAEVVNDPEDVYRDTKAAPKRHPIFPIAITVAECLAWGVTLYYFGAHGWWLAMPLVAWLIVLAWGLIGPDPD